MKRIFALQEAAYVNEWFGMLPNEVTLLIFKKRREDIQTKTYRSYPVRHINIIRIPKNISSEKNFTTIKVIDHVVYTVFAILLLPYILAHRAVLFVTPPFWSTVIIPVLRFLKKEIYIVASDPQTRLFYTYKESGNPLLYVYVKAATFLEEIALRSATKVFVVSKYMAELYGKKSRRVFYTPNGADAKLIDKIKPKRVFKEFTVTYMGSFDPWRGVDMLVEAFSMLQKKRRNVKLLLIGGGGNIEKVRRMAKGNKDIMITGWIRSHEEVIAYCKGSDALVMAPRYSEMAKTVSSMKCFEYIAAGVPLIVTDTGEHAELVKRLSVGLVAEANPRSIAEAIASLMSDKKSYSLFKSNCRKHRHQIDFTVTRKAFTEEINSP